MIKFSIIMAAYNAEKYIAESIESVLNQKYNNWELIIVDDGSTDNTLNIINSYNDRDKRIKVIHQDNSGTAAAARNRALEVLDGDYIQMLDADDLLESSILEKYSNKITLGNYDILIPDCIYFKNDDINEHVWLKKLSCKEDINGEEAFRLSLNWSIHGFFCIKKDIALKIRYDSNLLNGDEFTTRKFLYNSQKIGFVDSVYFYRKNINSTTKSKKNQYKMYECLLTDLNIYKYSLEKKMPIEIIRNCESNLLLSFWSYSRDYTKGNIFDRKSERKKANYILKKVFYSINRTSWKSSPVKLRILYYISLGIYEIYRTELYMLRII